MDLFITMERGSALIQKRMPADAGRARSVSIVVCTIRLSQLSIGLASFCLFFAMIIALPQWIFKVFFVFFTSGAYGKLLHVFDVWTGAAPGYMVYSA